MDVHCSACDEPWATTYLRYEAVHETDLDQAEASSWLELPAGQKLSERYREQFQAAGWMFGGTVLNVIRCPCCPEDARANPEMLAVKAALEDLLGDDEDALATTLADHRL